MKCPICKKRSGVELDTHADGFVSGGDNLKECSYCGTVWLKKADGTVEIIKDGTKTAATAA